MSDEKRIIEVVVKATGDADLKKLATELAAMRREAAISRGELEKANKELAKMGKEAVAARKEVQQTNNALGNFGSMMSKVGKAFTAGFAIKNLVQSSKAVQDLTAHVRELSGEFIDATLEAVGFTDALDESFWMMAKQGARDLGTAIGEIFQAMKKAGEDSGVDKFLRAAQNLGTPGGLIRTVGTVALNQYTKDMKYEIPPISQNQWTETLADLSRDLVRGRDEALKDQLEASLKNLTLARRSERQYADWQTTEKRETADLDRWLSSIRAAQPDRIDRNLDARLKNFAADFDASLKPVVIDMEQIGDSMSQMTEDGQRFQDNWERIAAGTYSWTEALDNAVGYMEELSDLQGDLTNQALAWGDSLTYAFKGVLTGELHNTRDALRSITLEMRNFYAELAAREAASELLSWIKLAIGSIGSASTPAPSSAKLSAKGNAFDAGEIIPMAKGGIVTKPTVFPMARGIGLMGEAGPEAVMPLRRGSDGKLGVSASRSSIIVENHAQPVSATVIDRDNETRIVLRAAQMGADLATERVNRSMRTGYGVTARSLQQAYDVRRRV